MWLRGGLSSGMDIDEWLGAEARVGQRNKVLPDRVQAGLKEAWEKGILDEDDLPEDGASWRVRRWGSFLEGCCVPSLLGLTRRGPPAGGLAFAIGRPLLRLSGYGWVARARVHAHVLVLRAPSACVPLRHRACVL